METKATNEETNMAIDFSRFKMNVEAEKDRLAKALKSASKFAKADDVWKPSVDADGNGQALIRFIYNPDISERFYVPLRNHGVKINGKWIIENCPKSLDWNRDCPICEYAQEMVNNREWKNIPFNEQNEIRRYFANQSFWCNIYVIKDPMSPENEGKVFKYRFGKKIMDKIENALTEDPLEGTPGFSAFDPFEGADFKLIIKRVGGYQNYDDSRFSVPSPLMGGDEEMLESILEKCYNIEELIEEDKFKSYDELQAKLFDALNIKRKKIVKEPEEIEESEEIEKIEEIEKPEKIEEKPKKQPKTLREKFSKTVEPPEDEDDEDFIKLPEPVGEDDEKDSGSGSFDENYFKKLVEDI